MRVGSISSSYVPAVRKSNANKNFKADIRVEYTTFKDNQINVIHSENLISLLDYAQKAYKNLGNNNMLIILKPLTNAAKKEKNLFTDIKVLYGYKDPELGRLDMIYNLKKQSAVEKYHKFKMDEARERTIKLLEEKDASTMNALKDFNDMGRITTPGFDVPYDFKAVTKESLDYAVKKAVSILEENVHFTPRDIPLKIEKANKEPSFWERWLGDMPEPMP